MANAACKLLLCGHKLQASIASAATNSEMADMNLQTLLDADLTGAEQQEMIDNLNAALEAFDKINDNILTP